MDTHLSYDMSTQEMLIYGVVGLVAIIIIFRVLKTLVKWVFIAAILFGLYWLYTSGSLDGLVEPQMEKLFSNTTISQLMDQHCTPDKADKAKCKCLITPVYIDLNQRFTKTQIRELEANKKQMVDEMMTSFSNVKSDVKDCLGDKKDDKLKWVDKLKGIVDLLSKE